MLKSYCKQSNHLFRIGISIFLIMLLTVQVGQVQLAFAGTEKTGPTFAASDASEIDYVPGELIVKYSDAGERSIQSSFHALDVKTIKSLSEDVQLVEIPDNQDVEEMAEKLENDPAIEYAEPNYILRAFDGVPSQSVNDTYYSDQWSLPMMHAPEVWDSLGEDNTVTVAVVDTGVDAEHPDLQGRLLTGHNCADKKSTGKWYVNEEPIDDHGHGTHVSGIIAAISDNNLGITGVAGPGNVRILPVKVLNDKGQGTSLDVAEGIRYAADHGADMINLSLGGGYPSSVGRDAIAYAQDLGCIVIAAAGNECTRVEYTYPASYAGVVSVGAINENKERAWFSNYGPTLDVASPGVGVLSTVPSWLGKEDKAAGEKVYGDDQSGYYEAWSGTSMATPNVVGVAALYKLSHPNASALEISEMLTSTAEDIGELGRDTDTGFGLVDATAMMGKEPVKRALAVLSPRENSEVSKTITLKMQIGMPDKVKSIDIYLDGTTEENKLTTISCSQDSLGYSWDWDTTDGVEDGDHTLYAIACDSDGQAVGNPTQVVLPLTVKNTITSGLGLEVKDPDGEVACSSHAYVFSKGSGAAGESYELLGDYYANDSGYIRVPGYAQMDEGGYEVVILGRFENESGNASFLYQQHYDEPGSYTIDGAQTVKTSLDMEGLNGSLHGAMICVAPIDDSGNRMGTIGTLQNEDCQEIYIDKGDYDFFGFWNSFLGGIIKDISDTGDEGQQEPTYFLTKRQTVDETTSSITITTENAGKVCALPQEKQDSTILYLSSPGAEEVWGIPFVDSSFKGSELIVNADTYEIKAEVEKKADNENWIYSLEKDEPVIVPADLNQPVEVNFGGSIEVAEFTAVETVNEGKMNKGDTLKTCNKIADSYGNELTRIYGPSDNYYAINNCLYLQKPKADGELQVYAFSNQQENSFAKVDVQWSKNLYPTFAIYNSDKQLVYEYSTWSYFEGCNWNSGKNYNGDLPPQVGSYTAKLMLEAGPLAENGIAQKSFDFELVMPSGQETHDVVVGGLDGSTPVSDAKIDIYKWEQPDAEQLSGWQLVQSYQTNYNGVANLSMNMDLSKEGHNLAVVRTGRYCTVKAFTNINELDDLDFANTVPVNFEISDRYGNKQLEQVKVPIYYPDKDNQPELVTQVSLRMEKYKPYIYLEPGVYPYIYSNFNRGSDTYLLTAKDVQVEKTASAESVVVTLAGQAAAHVQAEVPAGYTEPLIVLHPGDRPEIDFPEVNTKYFTHYYVSPDTYLSEITTECTADDLVYHFGAGSDPAVTLEGGQDYTWRSGELSGIELMLAKNTMSQDEKLTGKVLIQDIYGNALQVLEKGDFGINPSLKVYAQSDNGEESLLMEESNAAYCQNIDVALPKSALPGTYRAELVLQVAPDNSIKTELKPEYIFTITRGSGGTEEAVYHVAAVADAAYLTGVTTDGIQTMTVKNDVSGFRYFTAAITPVKEHYGQEVVVFVHLRDGLQMGINATEADFDSVEHAQAGFNVKAGDVVKVYIVDDLSNALDFNPIIFQ